MQDSCDEPAIAAIIVRAWVDSWISDGCPIGVWNDALMLDSSLRRPVYLTTWHLYGEGYAG
eukprot:5258373-Karenia_brevis.AAC.1